MFAATGAARARGTALHGVKRSWREEVVAKNEVMTQSEGGQVVPDGSLLVNGVEWVVPLPCTVAALLARLELAGKRVAVAIDRNVVPRSRYAEAQVFPGSRVEILEAVGGG